MFKGAFLGRLRQIFTRHSALGRGSLTQTNLKSILLGILQNKKNTQRVKEFKEFQKECFFAEKHSFSNSLHNFFDSFNLCA
jgi:hypothetical protein